MPHETAVSLINDHPPKIIWIRTGNLSTREITRMMIDNYVSIKAFLEEIEFEGISCLELE